MDTSVLDELVRADKARVGQLLELGQLGLCADCPRIATIPCPDSFARCDLHAAQLAKRILAQSPSRYVNRLSAQGKKARAKRRKARKLAKR